MVDWFMWLSDGHQEHAHLNLKTPFMYDSGFNLDQMNRKYWDIYRRFIELHKEFNLHPCPHLFMDRYCYGPYNSNGWSFFQPESYPSQRMVAHNALDIMRDVFGRGYKPWVKPLNEGAHYGSTDQFHVLGQWHRMMWEDVIRHYTYISRLIVDVSMSEGCQIYLNEVLPCGKPYVEGETHGDPNHDRADVNRSILAETHTVSTKEDFIGTEKLLYLTSKWQRYKFHGDGSDKGSFDLAGTGFRQGNADETYEMARYLWTRAKEHGKQAIYSIFPMESFRDDLGNWNLWFENYNVNNIFWDRLSAVQRAWEEIYG